MKTVLIYSGGLDSTTLLYHLRELGHEVACLLVNYGQRHAKELFHAEAICLELGVPYRIADLSPISALLAGSSQTSAEIEVPEGHYADETMKLTVVPNRNMIMLSIAIGWALSLKFDAVAFGAHGGDHPIYHDCREVFASAMSVAAQLCDERPIFLLRPFVSWDKTTIVARGRELGVPFEKTWSCYKGGELHCGKCGTCIERRESFALADVPDPTEYSLIENQRTILC